MPVKFLSAAFIALALWTVPATAQDIVLYRAYIGAKDLVNSDGKKLTEAWQVLRQDRANYHRFAVRQPGDEADPLFADADQRAALEALVKASGLDKATRAAILKGNVLVEVRIYGKPARAEVRILH